MRILEGLSLGGRDAYHNVMHITKRTYVPATRDRPADGDQPLRQDVAAGVHLRGWGPFASARGVGDLSKEEEGVRRSLG